jgi:hypothetical protein
MTKSLNQKLRSAWYSMDRVQNYQNVEARKKCKDGTSELRELLGNEVYRRTKEEIYPWAIIYNPSDTSKDDLAAWTGLYQECWNGHFVDVLREANHGTIKIANKDEVISFVRKVFPLEEVLLIEAELTNMLDRDVHLKAGHEAWKNGDYETANLEFDVAVNDGYEFLELMD